MGDGQPLDGLRFFGLRGDLAYYAHPDAITGGPRAHLQYFASYDSVRRRFRNRVSLSLPVEDDGRAILAFRRAHFNDNDLHDANRYAAHALK